VTFTCNICGTKCDHPVPLVREHKDCPTCHSSVRLRGLIALVSNEIFGTLLTLPEFPVLKGVKAIGMSDTPEVAELLAEKFDYTNTFYHQSPVFDLTNPNPRDEARYDFILSSEVLEHVPPPVDQAFATLRRMLKPDGLLLMTTPYNLDGRMIEHFPELHVYTLASLDGRPVLINRRADGRIETFENLTFHGGHGSTLETRVFTEPSLRAILCNAGFAETHFAADAIPEFGIDHAESWSLPIAARKGKFHPPAAELALEYREACRLAARKIRDLESITAEYERHVAHHNLAHEEWNRDTALRAEWVKKVEAAWEERTAWALEIQKARDLAIAEFRRVAGSEAEAWQSVDTLAKDLEQARADLARLGGSKWTKLGRKLGLL
jgi:SAM-dependent methyltransferase